MTDQPRRLVNHQQIRILMNDLEKLSQRYFSIVLRLALSSGPQGVSSPPVNQKRNLILPVLLMVVLASTRLLVGVLPQNFSAIYALAFCGAVYFSGAMAWWVPLGILLGTDIILNVMFYGVAPISWFMLANYLAIAAIILLGRRFKPSDSWLKLLGGGLLGAVMFYLITNTASWMQIPEYAKTFNGWIQALTTGLPGWPPTWMFFKNTLLSGGLFTGLFVGSMKLAEASEKKEAEAPEEEATPAEPEAEQAK